jgi:tRNA threonylcarbamoyladenosine biosynthesis protein TsaE
MEEASERALVDAEATEALGAEVAQACRVAGFDSLDIHLSGPLGAGKTTWVRGFLRRLGVEGAVRSPTYTLIETYGVDRRLVHHLDLYRIADPEELELIGARDLFAAPAIRLVEWPERGAGWLPGADLEVWLEESGSGRRVRLVARSAGGKRLLGHLPAPLIR